MLQFLDVERAPCVLVLIMFGMLEIIADAFDASITCRASSCWLDGYCYVELPALDNDGSSAGDKFAVHRHEERHGVGALALFTADHTGSYCSENGQSSMSKYQVMFSDEICLPLGLCAVFIGVGGIVSHLYLSRDLEGRDDSLLDIIKATAEQQETAARWNRWFKIIAILGVVGGSVYGLYFGVIRAGRNLRSFLEVISFALLTTLVEIWYLSVVRVDVSSIDLCRVTFLFGDVENFPDQIKAARVKEVIKEMRERSTDASWKPSLAEVIAFLFQKESNDDNAAGSKTPIELTTAAPIISDASLGHASPAPDQGGEGAIDPQNFATV